MAQAEARDRRIKQSLKAPLERDKGQGIKVYETEFGRTERDRLREKSQLDNMP
jgi:hypothetical protein